MRKSLGYALSAMILLVAGLGVLGSLARQETQGGLKVGTPTVVASEFPGGNQRWPDVAWGGGVYLVVWQEGSGYEGTPEANIVAARIAADGKPLDPKGIAICRAPHHQLYPKVTFDGSNFVVAWQDYRSGRDWDIFATRVTPEGKVLDGDGFPVGDGPGNQVHPSLASDGKRTFLVWSDLRPNPHGPERYVLAGTFLQDGKLAKPNGTVLSEFGKNGSLLGAIARWDGDGYLVAAQKHPDGWSYGGPWLLRVKPDGQVETIPFAYFGHSYTLATDPQSRRAYLWSYRQIGHGSYNCVFQSAVWPKGERHLVVGMPQHYAPANELWATSVFNGKHFLVVSERGTDVKGDQKAGAAVAIDLVASRIDPMTGQPLDFGSVPFDGKNPEKLLPKIAQLRSQSPTGVVVVSENGVFERQPALASSGDGRSLLVFSRHAGPGKFVVHCVLLTD
jgi:hypothetical protein